MERLGVEEGGLWGVGSWRMRDWMRSNDVR